MSNPNRTVRTHTNFIEIKIHTAKCDTCNKHNTSTMFRCADCGQQCCTACWTKKGGDGTHVLNAGDKGWTPERAQVLSMSRSQRKKPKASENGVVKKRALKRKAKYVVNDDEDEEEEGVEEKDDETLEEGKAVEKQTRRAKRPSRQPGVAETGEASAAPPNPQDHAGLSNDQPLTRSTSTQTDRTVIAAADHLLLNAIDPSSPTADGFTMILKAAAHIDNPQGHSQATTASTFHGAASEASLQQDAQAQTPLFVEDDLDLESEPVSQDTQGKKCRQVSWVDSKGKGRQTQDEEDSAEKDERSTMWE